MASRRHFTTWLAAAGCAFGPGRVLAQTGRRPITLVVPYPPGGATDALGRVFARALGSVLGETVIVENRPGANGITGAAHVAGAAPDGRTLLYGVGNLMLNQEFMLKSVQLSPLRDLTPVALVCAFKEVILAAAGHPASDLREFVALARRNPGRHSFAFYGDLGISAMAAGAAIELIRIPYKGGGPGLVDTAAGHVDIYFGTLAQSKPLLRAGKVKLLAVTTAERLEEFPEVPTVDEVVPGFGALVDYHGLFLPRGAPAEVVETIWAATSRVLASPEFRQAVVERDAFFQVLGPVEFAAYMRKDRASIEKIVGAAGIRPE